MIISCLKCGSHVDTGEKAPGEIVICRCGLGILVPEPLVTAGKLACPKCGAAVDPSVITCEFCGVRLQTVICPKCFGVVFEGSNHCTHCGEKIESEATLHHGDKSMHLCPRCETHPNLWVEYVAGLAVERCPECEGLWIDDAVSKRLYTDTEIQYGAIGASIKKNPKPVGSNTQNKVVKPEGYIKCPECGKMMNRTNFGRYSGVVIDTCIGHGTWYDADELRQILEFIRSGGLKKKERREKEDAQMEAQRARYKDFDKAPGSSNRQGAVSFSRFFSCLKR